MSIVIIWTLTMQSTIPSQMPVNSYQSSGSPVALLLTVELVVAAVVVDRAAVVITAAIVMVVGRQVQTDQ